MAEQRKHRKFTASQELEIVLAELRGDRTVKDVCRERLRMRAAPPSLRRKAEVQELQVTEDLQALKAGSVHLRGEGAQPRGPRPDAGQAGVPAEVAQPGDLLRPLYCSVLLSPNDKWLKWRVIPLDLSAPASPLRERAWTTSAWPRPVMRPCGSHHFFGQLRLTPPAAAASVNAGPRPLGWATAESRQSNGGR